MKIGNFDLNKDGVYIIAELSANHNGSLQTALDTIKSCKRDRRKCNKTSNLSCRYNHTK